MPRNNKVNTFLKATLMTYLITLILQKYGVVDIYPSPEEFIRYILDTTNIPTITIVLIIVSVVTLRGYLYLLRHGNIADKINKEHSKLKNWQILFLLFIGALISLTPYIASRVAPAELKPKYNICRSQSSSEEVSMSLEDAVNIAQKSNCATQGKILESGVCNGNTSSWWVDIENPILDNKCLPACVINIKTGTTRYDARCSN